MVRGALNEGKSSPLTVRITGQAACKWPPKWPQTIKQQVVRIPGVVDARIIQRMNYPELMINVDRAKAAELGLTQGDVMRNVVSATQLQHLVQQAQFLDRPGHAQPVFRRRAVSGERYSVDRHALDIPITSPNQKAPVPLRSVATISRTTVPSEVTHANIQPTIDLTMNVEGRDLGHIADDVAKLIGQLRKEKLRTEPGRRSTRNRPTRAKMLLGSKIVLTGEYARMQDTFNNLGVGLLLASLLMYFLMVGLDRSFLVPLTVMLVVPMSLGGVLPMLYFTGTALNVQSLLGIIFVVGIKVANTVLMTDFAQELRRHEGLTPTEAIRKAASIRVRPVTMTALAAFFAMIPAAFALERGSEANAPLARAILGGLLAGEPATLFVLPAFFSLLIRDKKPAFARPLYIAAPKPSASRRRCRLVGSDRFSPGRTDERFAN